MKTEQATAAVFYTAFKALKHGERQEFIGKVLGDPRLREELLDIALIEQAKQIKGKGVSAEAYFARRRGSKPS